MKRWTVMFLTAACALSLAACGTQKPSLDEVKQAIAEGTVTLEDAVGKGWVTQEWADEYLEENSVPAADTTSTWTRSSMIPMCFFPCCARSMRASGRLTRWRALCKRSLTASTF